MLLQAKGVCKQLRASLTLKACTTRSGHAAVGGQRHLLRKRLAATAAAKRLVDLVGAEVPTAVAALRKSGWTQVAPIRPLPSMLAHVNYQRGPRCGHVAAEGTVTGIGA